MTMRSPLRWFVCLSILALILLTSIGGSASASTTAGTLDETDRAIALIAISDASTTAGTLDETDRALGLIETHDASVASGDPSWAPTANEHSIQLTESRNAPGGILAGNPAPPARVAYEDSEHAVAQNGTADEVAVVETNRGQPF